MDNNYDMAGADNQLLEQMLSKRTKNTGVAERVAAKRAKEKASLRNIKSKVGLALVEDTPVAAKKMPLTEAEVPILDFVKAVKNSSGPVNSEFEPISLNWMPTTFEAIRLLNPQAHAITDLKMVLSGAVQQPGTSVAIVGPGDAKGTGFFVKADSIGNFFIAAANKNRNAFANPGNNSDGDGDADDIGKTISPNTGPESFASILNIIKEGVMKLESDIADLKKTTITEKKMDLSNLDGMDTRSKALITKLLAMAKDIREGGNGNIPDVYTDTALPNIGASTKGNLLTEADQEELSASIIEQATEALSTLSNQKSTKKTEEVAMALTDIIAENLLTGNVNAKAFSEAITKYNKLVG